MGEVENEVYIIKIVKPCMCVCLSMRTYVCVHMHPSSSGSGTEENNRVCLQYLWCNQQSPLLLMVELVEEFQKGMWEVVGSSKRRQHTSED